MKKVVLITPHYFDQKRRTGFFWVANAFHQMGWQVLFFTSPVSLISRLNKDNRLQYGLLDEKHQLIEKKPNFFSYVHYTQWHKVDLTKAFKQKWLGQLTRLLFAPVMRTQQLILGESTDFVKSADLIIFESTPSLELMPQFKQVNQSARYVYRVSDDLDVLRVHSDTKAFQQDHMQDFDFVSCTNAALQKKLQALNTEASVSLDYHGIEKALFDQKNPSPYPKSKQKNAVFVGVGDIDYDFLRQAPDQCPDWHFHYLGPIDMIDKENVTMYGEVPFETTIPYVQHADAGLNCRAWSQGAETFTDTLKVMQFCYCRIPIITPEFLKTHRNNTFYYQPNDVISMKSAMDHAREYDPHKDDMDYRVNSWQDVALALKGPL